MSHQYAEDIADELLYQQQTAAAEFRTLVSRFIAEAARIEFPLGPPGAGLRRGVGAGFDERPAPGAPGGNTSPSGLQLDLARHINEPDPDRAYEERRDRTMEDRWAAQ